MTEVDWEVCAEPVPMLEFARGRVSNRKFRLFAEACCRNVWEWLPEHSRRAVELAERYADKQATRAELLEARRDTDKDAIVAGYWDGSMACGWYAASWGLWEAVTGVVRCTQVAPRPPEWLRAVAAKRSDRVEAPRPTRAPTRSGFGVYKPSAKSENLPHLTRL